MHTVYLNFCFYQLTYATNQNDLCVCCLYKSTELEKALSSCGHGGSSVKSLSCLSKIFFLKKLWGSAVIQVEQNQEFKESLFLLHLHLQLQLDVLAVCPNTECSFPTMGEENPVCLWEAEGSNRGIFAGNLYLSSGKKK